MTEVGLKNESMLDNYYPSWVPDITVITPKTGKEIHGFVEKFDDSDELLEKNCFRFVPMINSEAYKIDIKNNKRLNPDHSILIDLNEIKSIRLVNKNTRKIVHETLFT